jgi:hypothetical protein
MSTLGAAVMVLVLGCAGVAQAGVPRESLGAVSVRIHDYATIERSQVQQAERMVSDSFDRIGVQVDWRPVAQPVEIAAGRGTWPIDTTSLTVVLLTPAMGARLALPEGVAGYAPLSRAEGGRVAFVLADRTARIAQAAGVEQGRVLAGVISHELAHLLMPGRSHSAEGLMRAQWSTLTFRRVERERFTAADADAIRRTVRDMRGPVARVGD